MVPGLHAAVLLPLLCRRLLPGAAVLGGGVAGVLGERGAGVKAHGEAGAAHHSVPGGLKRSGRSGCWGAAVLRCCETGVGVRPPLSGRYFWRSLGSKFVVE